mmetsp:Transcript_25234/g.37263  ORF Transcript_25234/g.37263 Transcript_25234/m.37263 type:complete len:401 (+) Transcript_25234:104-1306(+)
MFLGMPKFTLLLIFCCFVVSHGAGGPMSPSIVMDEVAWRKQVMMGEVQELNPFDDNNDNAISFKATVVKAGSSVIMALYGVSLMFYGHQYPGQMRCLSTIRGSGQSKLEQAIKSWKQNYKDAKFQAVRCAPSFYRASRSLRRLDKRIFQHQRIQRKTKQALVEGSITREEARRLKRMQKRAIRHIRRDMKRIARATLDVGRIFKILDFDEIIDISRTFLFQILAVLTSENESTRIGSLVLRWIIFLNIGSLLFETIRKLDFPIAKVIHKRKKSFDVEKQVASIIMVYGTSAYLVMLKNGTAKKLNSALTAAAIVMRGIRWLSKTLCDGDTDDIGSRWSALVKLLDSQAGGYLMLSFTATSLFSRHLVEKEKLPVPIWLDRPLRLMDEGVDYLSASCSKKV